MTWDRLRSSRRSRIVRLGAVAVAALGLFTGSGCPRPLEPPPEPSTGPGPTSAATGASQRPDAGTPAPEVASADAGLSASGAAQVSDAPARSCSSDHWCWYNPLPYSVMLNAVWVTEGGSVWAAGAGGVIWRWNGAGFVEVPSGIDQDLLELWGSGEEAIWAVGAGGTILRWDGTRWSVVASGTTSVLHGVWGTSTDDVWAVGEGGTVLHWDGAAWTAVPSGTPHDLFGVWASGASDAWAVGYGGLILRWNGSAWRRVGSPARLRLYAVWGFGPDDVWVGGTNATVLHWNGSGWTSRGVGSTSSAIGIWGSRPDDVWVLFDMSFLTHWDGHSVTRSPADGANLRGIHGNASGEGWMVASNSVTMRLEEGQWRWMSSVTPGGLGDFASRGADDVWASARAGMLHWDGSSWTRVSCRGQRTNSLEIVALSGPDDAWATQDGGCDPNFMSLWHWDGTEWRNRTTELPLPSASTGYLTVGATWQTGRVFYAVVSEPEQLDMTSTLVRWNGRSWETITRTAPNPANWGSPLVGGSGPNDVWLIGAERSLHFDGSRWSPVPFPPAGVSSTCGYQSLTRLWSVGPDDAWLIAWCTDAGSQVLHWDGHAWSVVDAAGHRDLTAVWASGPSDAWAVGDAGTILHWDGSSWTPRQSGTTERLLNVWGSGAGDIWVSGAGGSILRYHP